MSITIRLYCLFDIQTSYEAEEERHTCCLCGDRFHHRNKLEICCIQCGEAFLHSFKNGSQCRSFSSICCYSQSFFSPARIGSLLGVSWASDGFFVLLLSYSVCTDVLVVSAFWFFSLSLFLVFLMAFVRLIILCHLSVTLVYAVLRVLFWEVVRKRETSLSEVSFSEEDLADLYSTTLFK